MMMEFKYGIESLTVDKVISIANGTLKGVMVQEAIDQVQACREKVLTMAYSDKAVYGVNTGFGPLCDVQIKPEQTGTLQRNLLISHAVGVGNPIDKQLSKIMLICKLQALSQGFSGVRMELINRIQYFINHDLIPVVPEQGSVGASGDLAPLSHLFLPLLGEGEIWVDEKPVPTKEVYAKHKLEPLKLAAKEGLGLINGTQFILAHAIVGLNKMEYLLDLADVSGAMSLEGFQGSGAPFKVALHTIRPFEGTMQVAQRLRMLLKNSQNLHSHKNCGRVQDPYSIRCMPQVHGASRNAYNHLKELTQIEMNSVTDNPIVITAAELGNISDRRSYLLLEGKCGLPRLLTNSSGLNSGFMIPQYTTAALVTENKSLCFPPSADSVPTSLGQEDHVSMGSISGRQFNQILGNLEKILAIELMYAAQAMDFRRPNTFGQILEVNHQLIRSKVPMLEDDRLLKDDIKEMITLVKQRKIKTNY